MDALSSIACFSTTPKLSPRPPLFKKTPPSLSVSRASAQPLSELAEDDVLRVFLRERQLNGDFISKACDKFWQRGVAEFDDIDIDKLSDIPQESEQVMESDNNGGFLKLSRTQEWVLGENAAAPMNKKAIAKALQDDSGRRKRLNLLEYEAATLLNIGYWVSFMFRKNRNYLTEDTQELERASVMLFFQRANSALKRELALLSVGIGAGCTGYCLVVLSVQAAASYAIGVLFRIGIRSEDLRDSFERTIKGSGIALSSPRIVIPAAIYGLWVLSHQYFPNDFFEIQIVPAMLGMFVYKAAALVQVYRDNDDLKFVFPDSEDGSSD